MYPSPWLFGHPCVLLLLFCRIFSCLWRCRLIVSTDPFCCKFLMVLTSGHGLVMCLSGRKSPFLTKEVFANAGSRSPWAYWRVGMGGAESRSSTVSRLLTVC